SKMASQVCGVLFPDGEVGLSLGVLEHRPRGLADRGQPLEREEGLVRRARGSDGRQGAAQEVDWVVVTSAETRNELGRLDGDELRRRAVAERMDDAEAGQLLDGRVDLRRRDAGALGELVTVLRP